MSEYDYKEEANKLKEQRNLPFDPMRSRFSKIYEIEKQLSEIYDNDLESYKKVINKVLDKIEKDKKIDITDSFDLDLFYRTYLNIEIMYLVNPPHILSPFKTEEEYINSIKCKFEG